MIIPSNTNTGWIGTGEVGPSMCGHLLTGGHRGTVHRRTRSKAHPLVDPQHLMILALLLVAGCAGSQGLHREALHERLQEEERRFAGQQSPKAVAVRPSGQTSPKLGLYLNPTGFLQREFEWTDTDREALLAWAGELSSSERISSASFIPQSSLKGNTLAELRESAARYGADLLLVIDGAAAVDHYNNYKGPLLYWTILGAYLADGTQSDALCLLRASVWDVKTGAERFTEEGEGRAQQVGPAARVEDRVSVLTARQKALSQLLTTVKYRLGQPRMP